MGDFDVRKKTCAGGGGDFVGITNECFHCSVTRNNVARYFFEGIKNQ